jgi:hypothetical protein
LQYFGDVVSLSATNTDFGFAARWAEFMRERVFITLHHLVLFMPISHIKVSHTKEGATAGKGPNVK